jgi:hypothetical protein
MVAVAIIAMALVAALGSQSQSVSLANEAKFTTTVAFLAQGNMAELETKDPGGFASDTGDFGEDFPGYRWESEVGPVDVADVSAVMNLSEFAGAMDLSDVGFMFEGFGGKILEHVEKIVLTVYWAEEDKYQYRLVHVRTKE